MLKIVLNRAIYLIKRWKYVGWNLLFVGSFFLGLGVILTMKAQHPFAANLLMFPVFSIGAIMVFGGLYELFKKGKHLPRFGYALTMFNGIAILGAFSGPLLRCFGYNWIPDEVFVSVLVVLICGSLALHVFFDPVPLVNNAEEVVK